MKIAVGLFGIHFNSNYKHWMGWDCNVDYRRSLENYKEKLFTNNNDYSFYSSTYDSTMLTDLKSKYKFRKLIVNKYTHAENVSLARNTKFVETLDLIKEDNQKYDFVMITRYDLLFKTTPLLKSINYDRVNVLHGGKWGDDDSIVDDNWYFFDFKLLNNIINILKQNMNLHSHCYNQILDINLLDNNHYYSHQNPDYTILR